MAEHWPLLHFESKTNHQILRVVCWLICGVCCCSVPPCLFAQGVSDSYTVEYFEQLRKRRLFSVAEQLGSDRLADQEVSPEEFIPVTVELSKTYAEHARYTSGDEHDLYWQFAESVLDEALRKHGEHPRSLLLEIQKAFVPAARGEFLRGQLELFPYDPELKKQTESVFETALERLKPIESELARKHRQLTLNGRRADNDLATFEIHDLHSEVRFRLAVTLQEFAKTKSPFSPTRSTLLKEAYPWLELLSESRGGDPFALPAKIRLAENHRMRNDLPGAGTLLTELETEALSQDLKDELLAERVRWLIDNQQLAEAERRLREYRQNTRQPNGELVFLHVFALMEAWDLAEKTQKPDVAKQRLEALQTELKSLPSAVGGYWAYRISLLGEQLEKWQKYGRAVAEKVQQAEAMYAAGQVDASVEAYGQAMASAAQNGKPEIAFQLGYTQGSILIQQQKYAEAAKRFHQLAADYPANTRGPSAQLLEAYSLGKIYEEDPTQTNLENYTGILLKHVETYPNHDSAGDAYWMLGQLDEQRRQITSALDRYARIPPDHRRGLAAQLAVGRCYEKILQRLKDLESTAADPQKPAVRAKMVEWEASAVKELGKIVAAYPEEPQPLRPGQADVVLRLARLHLMRTKPDYQQADSLLERLLVTGTQQLAAQSPLSESEQAEWTQIVNTARQLRIVSLAGQGFSDRATLLVQQLSNSSTQEVLSVMDGLTQIAEAADAATRRRLGELQLKTALELHSRRDQLEEAERERLDHCRAQAYLATNQPAEALAIYNQMLAARPNARELQAKIAGLLSDSENPQALAKAKELWRGLETQAKPGSVPWLERRYQVARCSWKLGQKEECRKLLGVTRLLYPELGNPELKAKYNKLQNEVDGNR